MEEHKTDLRLLPDNSQRLSNLCGRLNEHIKIRERALSLRIQQRGNIFYSPSNDTPCNTRDPTT